MLSMLLVHSLISFSFPVQFKWLIFGVSPVGNRSPPSAIAPVIKEKYYTSCVGGITLSLSILTHCTVRNAIRLRVLSFY